MQYKQQTISHKQASKSKQPNKQPTITTKHPTNSAISQTLSNQSYQTNYNPQS